MAKFTASVPLNIKWFGNEIVGAAGATHRIPDALYDEFAAQIVPTIPGGVTWVDTDEIATAAADDAASLAAKYDKAGGTISGAVTVTGALVAQGTISSVGVVNITGTTAGRFGVVDAPSNRIPVNIGVDLAAADANAAGTSNVIGIQLSPRITGNFSSMAGLDPGFVWGVSNFATLGVAGGSAAVGVTDFTGLVTETAIVSAGTTATTVRGAHIIAAFWGSAASGQVSTMESLRVTPPSRKDGATAGSATSAYGIHVEAPSGVGTSGDFAIFTAGGPSRFTGRLDIYGAVVQTDQMTLGGTSFPGGSATDDIFYRTDRRNWYFDNGADWKPIRAVPGVARLIAPVAIANTFTKVLGFDIPANFVVAGTTFKIKAYGRLTSGATPGSGSFQVYMPAVVPASIAIAQAANKTDAPFLLEAIVTIRTIGATGTAIGEMFVHGGTTVVPFTPTGDISANSGTVLYNSTIAGNVELYYTSGNAGTTATFEVATIELVAME